MIFKLHLVLLKRSKDNVNVDWSTYITPCDCSVIATLLSGKTEAGRQDCKNIFSSRLDHKAGLLFLPQRSYVREISLTFVQHRSYRGFLYFTRVDVACHLSERPALRVLIQSVKSDQSEGIPKKFLRLENSPPPITFLMVRP